MAVTQQLSNDPTTVLQFSTVAFVDMMKRTSFGSIASTSAVYEAKELNGSRRGDRITIPLVNILTGVGVGEGGTMVGREEALNHEAFSMSTGVFRNAVLNPNSETIEQERTYVDFDPVSQELLTEYHGSRLDASVFNVAAGCTATTITVDGTAYTGSNRLFVQGFNTPTAPTSNRILRAGGAANDQSLTSVDTMTLDLVDDALVTIMGTYPTMKPLENGMFRMYMSYQQRIDLERDATGQIQMYQLELAKMQGGKESIYTDADSYYAESRPWGRYKNVEFYCSTRIANGQNSSTAAQITTVNRAVIFGKNALVYGSPFGTMSGRGNKNGVGTPPLRMFVQLSDYEYYKGREGRMLYGLAKTVQDSQDLGTFVISTYAA